MLKRFAILNEPTITKIDTRYLMEFTGGDNLPCRINLKSTRLSVINEPNTESKIDTKYLMTITGSDTIRVKSKKTIKSKL